MRVHQTPFSLELGVWLARLEESAVAMSVLGSAELIIIVRPLQINSLFLIPLEPKN